MPAAAHFWPSRAAFVGAVLALLAGLMGLAVWALDSTLGGWLSGTQLRPAASLAGVVAAASFLRVLWRHDAPAALLPPALLLASLGLLNIASGMSQAGYATHLTGSADYLLPDLLRLPPLTAFGFILCAAGLIGLSRGAPGGRAVAAAIAIGWLVLSLSTGALFAHWLWGEGTQPLLVQSSPHDVLIQLLLALALAGLALPAPSGARDDMRRLIKVSLVAVVVASILVWSFFNWSDGTRVRNDAEQGLGNVARLMEEHVYRSLDPVEVVLRDLAQRALQEDVDAVMDSQPERDRLTAIVDALPQVSGLMLFDTAGTLRLVTRTPLEAGYEQFAEREFFQAHRAGAERHLGPLMRTSFGRLVFTYSYRLEDAAGEFAGVALAALDVTYFAEFYRSLALGYGASVALIRRDGQPLLREPLPELLLEQDLAAHPIYADLIHRQVHGIFYGYSPLDGQLRVIQYRATDQLPFVINVTQRVAQLAGPMQLRLMGSTLVLIVLLSLFLHAASLQLRSAERALRVRGVLEEGRRFVSSVIDALSAAVVIVGRDGRIVDANAGWRALLEQRGAAAGDARLDADYLRVFRAATGADAEAAAALEVGLAAVRAGREARYTQVSPGDGHWYGIRVTPLADGSGGVVVSHEDVSGIKSAELALAASEQRYRALIEGSVQAIAVCRVEEEFRPLFVNAAAARLFGYPSAAEAMAEGSFAHLMPPATRSEVRAWWQELSAGSLEHIHDRAPHLRRDRSEFWAEFTARRVDWEGRPALQVTLLDVTERQRLEAQLQRYANTDPLTGLLNRRQFGVRAQHEVRRARRHPQPLGVLMLDIDHFKRVNDSHGHAAGDAVIKAVAEVLRRGLRDCDLVARFGGEEFAAVLLADTEATLEVAERLRQAIAAEAIAFQGRQIEVTASIGVSEWRPGEASIERALQRADAALYRAKRGGRNRVVAGVLEEPEPAD